MSTSTAPSSSEAGETRCKIDISCGKFEVTDVEKQVLEEGFQVFLNQAAGVQKFLDGGRKRGVNRNLVNMWANLRSPNCERWKYYETPMCEVENCSWMEKDRVPDDFEDYLPIFNINDHGGVLPRDTLGMYAPGMNFPVMIDPPLCMQHSKYCIAGKVRRVLLESVNAERRAGIRNYVFTAADTTGGV
jgi:hypothetical protein